MKVRYSIEHRYWVYIKGYGISSGKWDKSSIKLKKVSK